MASTRTDVAGHPIAIRVGGRRLSQSQQSALQSPSKASTSPDDSSKASTSPMTSDYPRPDPDAIRPDAGTGGGHEDRQQEESKRRKKRGLKTDEAKNLLLNNAGSSRGRVPRHGSTSGQGAAGGTRIQQPSRGMAI